MIHRARLERLRPPCEHCGAAFPALTAQIGLEVFSDRSRNHTAADIVCRRCGSPVTAKGICILVGPLPCPPFKYLYGWVLVENWELDEGEAQDVPPEVIAGFKQVV